MVHMVYQSDYANQVHQLTVSISKHIILLKTGAMRFQKKPIDVNLANFSRSQKSHIAYYIVRDHYSGCFYAEIHSCTSLVPVEDFLFRAWSEKPNYEFCGAPDYLAVPETVNVAFPNLKKLMEDYGIEPAPVTSGFQSGAVRDVQTWENLVRQYVSLADGRTEKLSTWTPDLTCKASRYLNADRADRGSKIPKWQHGLKELRLPPKHGWYSDSNVGEGL